MLFLNPPFNTFPLQIPPFNSNPFKIPPFSNPLSFADPPTFHHVETPSLRSSHFASRPAAGDRWRPCTSAPRETFRVSNEAMGGAMGGAMGTAVIDEEL